MKYSVSIKAMAICFLALPANAVGQTRQGIQDVIHNGSNTIPNYFTMPDEGFEMAQDGEFPMDQIKNWSGTGNNRAAMVIQWNNDREEAAMVFGYRWDGEATGIDMIRCIVENNPRLYGLFQQTNVSSGKAKWGYTIDGFGWDEDNSGLPVAIYDSANDDTYYSNSGFFEHPRGCNESVSYPDYDYDNWKAVDENDFWQAGWYIGYWSYWLKENDDDVFKYSGIGASGRQLKDGCWDGWNYCPDMEPMYWLPFKAAEPLIPEDVNTSLTSDGINYKLTNYDTKSVEVTHGDYTGTVNIPASFTLNGVQYNVTAIGAGAFKGSKAKNIVIPESVGKIGAEAFEGSDLESISGGSHITQLGRRAFAECRNLKEPTLPPLLQEVPDECFAGSGITEANLPSTITKTGISSFAGCAYITKVSLPASLLSIGESSFANCTSVTEVKCLPTLPATLTENVFSTETYSGATLMVPQGFTDVYSTAAGWNKFVNKSEYVLDVNVGDRFLYKGAPIEITSTDETNPTAKVKCNHFNGVFRVTAVQLANEKLKGDINVPEYITYMGRNFKVTQIDPYAFYGAKNVTSVKFPKEVTGFGEYMYWNCSNLQSATVPDNIDKLGDYCFYGCMKLKEVSLPEGLVEIGKNALYGCSSLKTLDIPSSVKVIEERALQSLTGVSELKLPAGLKKIGQYALFGTGVTSLEIPESVEQIGVYALAGNRKLQSVHLPESLTMIPNGLLATSSQLTEVEIPCNVTDIGQNFIVTSGVQKVYLTNPDAKAQPKTFNTSTTGKYAEVITIPGHAASISGKDGYDKTTVTEPTPSTLAQEGDVVMETEPQRATKIIVTGMLKTGFEETLPERFAKHCSDTFLADNEVELKANHTAEPIPASRQADGCFAAEIDRPDGNTITYRWLVNNSDNTIESPEYTMKVSVFSDITDTDITGETVCSIFTTDGVKVAQDVKFCETSLSPGIYIVNNKKVIIKQSN